MSEWIKANEMKTPKQLAFEYCDKAPVRMFDRLFVSLEEIRVAAFINGYKAAKDQVVDVSKVIPTPPKEEE